MFITMMYIIIVHLVIAFLLYENIDESNFKQKKNTLENVVHFQAMLHSAYVSVRVCVGLYTVT